jgi:two-component system response regulator AtoC
VLLLVADHPTRRRLTGLLRKRGYQAVSASSVDEALAALAQNRFLFTLLDMDLAGAGGAEFLQRLKIHGSDAGPIVLTDGHDASSTLRILSLRADDLTQRPPLPEELGSVIKDVLSWSRRVRDSVPGDPEARLQQEVTLWRSPRMREVWEVVQQAARVDVTVLICGETGTGKELVARAIHHLSPRHDQPFVKINCAAVPRELLESELFGHERGAFTGAHRLKIGKFESANHGTVFLDEIGDLHPSLQAKLLHVLQDGTFSRVGGRSTIKVDVRVLAATNRDLERIVIEEGFREDLYYRLNVIQVLVPPLRERADEIPLLVEYFVKRYAKMFGRQGFTPTPSAMERLSRHRYSGNVRELENIVKRMIILRDPLLAKTALSSVNVDDGDGPRAPDLDGAISLKDVARGAARAAEREIIAKVLQETGWNRSRAAKLLKISYRALLYKMKHAGLHHDRGASTSHS